MTSTYNPNDFYPRTGQEIKSDGSTVNEADGINSDGSQNEVLVGRKFQLIQTQNNVTINANGWNSSSWINAVVSGQFLPNVGVSVNMASGTGMQVVLDFSHDGVNIFGSMASTLYNGAGNQYGSTQDVQLPSQYFRVTIQNKDATNAKVTNAYALLKA